MLKLKKHGIKLLELRFRGTDDDGAFEPLDIRPESVKEKVKTTCITELNIVSELMAYSSGISSWMFNNTGCRGGIQLDLTTDPPQLNQWVRFPGYYRPKKWRRDCDATTELTMSEVEKLITDLEINKEATDEQARN